VKSPDLLGFYRLLLGSNRVAIGAFMHGVSANCRQTVGSFCKYNRLCSIL
jgi:hypothetical protein